MLTIFAAYGYSDHYNTTDGKKKSCIGNAPDYMYAFSDMPVQHANIMSFRKHLQMLLFATSVIHFLYLALYARGSKVN